MAREAAIAVAPYHGVGEHVEAIDEGNGLISFLFASRIRGYPGWRWSVTIFQPRLKDVATVSEVVLLPGPESLLAPNWTPWAERLADFELLQAELSAAEAAEQPQEPRVPPKRTRTKRVSSASIAVLEQTNDSEAESSDAGPRPPAPARGRTRVVKKQSDDQGQSPEHDSNRED